MKQQQSRIDGIDIQASELRDWLVDADRKARDFSQQYPIVALSGALLFGYVVGRLASRI